MNKKQINTREEAQAYAIEWQQWASEQNKIGEKPTLFMSDMIEWADYFRELADRFNLTEEFEENGII